mmetsp:Transcript_33311/g.60204  ORF Transcript_33311/g.60204 Transcript_33311/m.60204 type:complete len:213 (-) Transcript_33311:563-1201(-)
MLRKCPTGESKSGKNFKIIDEILETEGPLDESEQETLLKEFEEIHFKTTRFWRRALGSVLMLMSTIYFYLFKEQINDPFTTKFTGQLRLVTGRKAASIFLAIQALSLIASSLLLLLRLPNTIAKSLEEPSRRSMIIMWSSLIGATCSGAYWFSRVSLNSQLQHKPGFLWDLLWEPAAAMLSCFLAIVTLQGLHDTSERLRSLRADVYRFKKV